MLPDWQVSRYSAISLNTAGPLPEPSSTATSRLVESIYPTPPELSEAIISAALSAFGSSPPVYLTSVRGSACAARNVSQSAMTLRLVR
jgi:hypothetical protein